METRFGSKTIHNNLPYDYEIHYGNEADGSPIMLVSIMMAGLSIAVIQALKG